MTVKLESPQKGFVPLFDPFYGKGKCMNAIVLFDVVLFSLLLLFSVYSA